MGKLWGNLFYIKNIAYHRVSPYELNPFASKCPFDEQFDHLPSSEIETNFVANLVWLIDSYPQNADFWKKSWQGITRDFTESGPFVITCEFDFGF